MKTHVVLGLPCIVLPFAFAVGLSLWAARESGAFAVQPADPSCTLSRHSGLFCASRRHRSQPDLITDIAFP